MTYSMHVQFPGTLVHRTPKALLVQPCGGARVWLPRAIASQKGLRDARAQEERQ